jgi:murein DD-endopeptidase MepM/ murein hydrolase activator NlpD
MVIPHNDDHVREFNLAAPLLWGAMVTLLLFVATASYFAYGYYARIGAEIEYSNLNAENTQLEANLGILAGQMGDLSERVSELTHADARMRAFARTTEPTKDSAGSALHDQPDVSGIVWASSDEYSGSEEYASLGQLTREAKLLQSSLDGILATVSGARKARRYIPSIFPVKGEGWYSSYFGYRTDPITGQRSFNNGIDIAGRKGTPIMATGDGIVDAAKHHQRLGHMVSIDHTNGLRTVYAHLEDHDTVRTGQRISRGDEIGKMSRSGTTTAVHLHYAVILHNKAEDPLKYIIDTSSKSTLF